MPLKNNPQDNEQLIFETDYLKYVITRDGRVAGFIDKTTGRNCLRDAENTCFAFLSSGPTTIEGKTNELSSGVSGTLVPTNAELIKPEKVACDANGVMTLTFPGEITARIIVRERADYLTFELNSELPCKYESITFANTPLAYPAETDDSFCAVGYAMSINTKVHYYPCVAEKAIVAECFPEIGCRGGKIAVIAVRQKNLLEAMKKVNGEIDPDEMLISIAGGPYADEVPENHGTYAIVSDIDAPGDLKAWYETYAHFGVDQIDFHQGLAFRQGDFHFKDDKYPGGAAEFRRVVTDPLKKAGFNSGMAYLGLSDETIKNYPALLRNAERYNMYEKLRKAGYFPDAIRKQMRVPQQEFALVDKWGGKYGLVRKAYSKSKLYSTGDGRNVVPGNNPFEAQRPFIRIEGLYSAASSGAAVTLMQRDESADIKTNEVKAVFDPAINIEGQQAIKVRICGNNSNGAICFQLTSPRHRVSGVGDFIVKLDFAGWREFVLAGTDNGEYPEIMFKDKHDSLYHEFREPIFFDLIDSLRIYTSGDCAGVKIGTVSAVECINSNIINPTLTVDGKSITFICAIASGEYLEYAEGGRALIYDRFGHARAVEKIDGAMPVIAKGDFKMKLTSEHKDDTPVRAKVAIGFTGAELQ